MVGGKQMRIEVLPRSFQLAYKYLENLMTAREAMLSSVCCVGEGITDQSSHLRGVSFTNNTSRK